MLMRLYDSYHAASPDKVGIAPTAEGLTDLTGYDAVAVGSARLIYAGETRLTNTMEEEQAAALLEAVTSAGAAPLLYVSGTYTALRGDGAQTAELLAAAVEDSGCQGLFLDLAKLPSAQREAFTALADTGNRLTEPFSGRPLVLVSMEKGRMLLTPSESRWLEAGMEGEDPPAGVRVAPYATVNGRGLLAVFRPDRLEIEVDGRWLAADGCLALSPGAGTPRDCDGIFHPGMIQLAAPAGGKGFQ